ncbi:MAG TPA: prolipoprotein diacylglyceryl transferase family protein, partial [Labilithrix sp.]|nr:prolipoprotein diacylglyceryl transferase family protein [Labilithrix sp.]
LDASASIIALNMAFGRVGCLLAGCCFGAPTSPGLFTMHASAFEPTSPVGVAYAGDPSVSLWATQVMEIVATSSIAVICEWLFRSRSVRSLRPGAVIVVGAGLYGFSRALLEIVRADSPRAIFGMFTIWQALGAVMTALALVWTLAQRRRPEVISGASGALP